MDMNVQRSLLESAARTATVTTPVQFDYRARALRLYLNVTVAVAGTGGLQPIINGYDKISGNAIALSTGGTAIVAVGTYVYEMALAVAAAAGNVKEAVSRAAPVQWSVTMAVGDATSYTYSLSAEVLG
jgi:hypothetical protein